MDCSTFAFDLHVLGTPPALILSQDQTLMFNVAALRLARLRGLTQGQLVKRELIIGSALFNPLLYVVVAASCHRTD